MRDCFHCNFRNVNQYESLNCHEINKINIPHNNKSCHFLTALLTKMGLILTPQMQLDIQDLLKYIFSNKENGEGC